MFREQLRKHNISITALSKILDVSRTTLYKLISTYEDNNTLPQERYKIVFDTIVNDNNLTNEQLISRLKSLKHLMEREKKIGSFDLSIPRADLLSNLIDSANNDLHKDDCNENIYKFMVALISSYHKEPVFQIMSKYFLVLNSTLDYSNFQTKDKPIFSNLYKIFSLYKKDSLQIDEKYLKELNIKIEELKITRDKQLEIAQKNIEDELKDKLKEKILEEVTRKLESGIEADNLDIEDIVNNILIE